MSHSAAVRSVNPDGRQKLKAWAAEHPLATISEALDEEDLAGLSLSKSSMYACHIFARDYSGLIKCENSRMYCDGTVVAGCSTGFRCESHLNQHKKMFARNPHEHLTILHEIIQLKSSAGKTRVRPSCDTSISRIRTLPPHHKHDKHL